MDNSGGGDVSPASWFHTLDAHQWVVRSFEAKGRSIIYKYTDLVDTTNVWWCMCIFKLCEPLLVCMRPPGPSRNRRGTSSWITLDAAEAFGVVHSHGVTHKLLLPQLKWFQWKGPSAAGRYLDQGFPSWTALFASFHWWFRGHQLQHETRSSWASPRAKLLDRRPRMERTKTSRPPYRRGSQRFWWWHSGSWSWP